MYMGRHLFDPWYTPEAVRARVDHMGEEAKFHHHQIAGPFNDDDCEIIRPE